MTLQLTNSPSVDTGMLIRRSPHDVFEALADPSITTRFWYTKSSGRMEEGAELTWEWEMYGVSGKAWVKEVSADRHIRFSWEGYDPAHPTTVEFLFV
ncbi:MAG: SRPBCC domain-containing protein, partial [Solirubrobacterales bacterium]|nr:SRPBCC domain-containing protein [Solirubrobacterales bacterium]